MVEMRTHLAIEKVGLVIHHLRAGNPPSNVARAIILLDLSHTVRSLTDISINKGYCFTNKFT